MLFFFLINTALNLFSQEPVKIREEQITLPTYPNGDPDPNPMFYNQESYQGAQKRIYPYPIMDH
jgi:hypothetical protein